MFERRNDVHCQDQGGSAQEETGRPEAPDEMDKVGCREGPGVDDSQRPDGEALWSLYMHVLCLQSAEWELRPCMQTFPCTAPGHSPPANEVFRRAIKGH